MTQEYINNFMLTKGEYFAPEMISDIQAKLASVDDSKAAYILSIDFQNPTLILIIAIFLGWERFFLDDIGMGVLKVLTCYGAGIWWLIDIFSAKKRACQYNYLKLNQALMFTR